MFSLIISIISIALVAALAAATVYFGGAAFNKGAAGADASAFVNAGQQIAGAFTLASTDGATSIVTIAGLEPSYLAQQPKYKGDSLVLNPTSNSGSAAADLLIQSYAGVEVSNQVCIEINKRATGSDTLPAASAFTATGLFGCQQVSAVVTGLSAVAANDYVAYYKVK